MRKSWFEKTESNCTFPRALTTIQNLRNVHHITDTAMRSSKNEPGLMGCFKSTWDFDVCNSLKKLLALEWTACGEPRPKPTRKTSSTLKTKTKVFFDSLRKIASWDMHQHQFEVSWTACFNYETQWAPWCGNKKTVNSLPFRWHFKRWLCIHFLV